MPKRPPRPCKHPGCPQLSHTGYCEEHAPAVPASSPLSPPRRSAARRGYGRGWRRIRERALTSYGIPRHDWPLYDIDHRPPYDPDVEPNHSRYTLVPMLRSNHSRKTARENGGFGNPLAGEGQVRSPGNSAGDRGGEDNISAVSKGDRG